MPGTSQSQRLAGRARQPGHDVTWRTSETAVEDLCRLLLPARFEVVAQPRDLAEFYSAAPARLGLRPELKITSTRTRRFVYVEVKRQGPSGNAEERVYKHHTVGFAAAVHDRFGLDYHPFVAVFCDNLATDRRYTAKFACHLTPGSYLCWAGYDPALLAGFLDSLINRWLEPGCTEAPCAGRLPQLDADPGGEQEPVQAPVQAAGREHTSAEAAG